MNARRDKSSTIFFTLPISCQICLGKVKQPVLCPNNHAFCSLCMDIWLQKIKQCPACRTPINPSNPIKEIKGGLNPVEDKLDKMSNPTLRKARFDLLYREYEDEFDRLEAELQLLKTENDVLKNQAANVRGQTGMDSEKCDFVHPSKSDTSGLLALTKKLQSAQKLYEHLKNDMYKVKQENDKLKDENVNLSRENEKLRIEIGSRSPHRYGRYTVATLEAKIESYEKENRQLNKALSRSDKYVDELEGELNKLKGTNTGVSSTFATKTLDLERKSISQISVNGSTTENNTAKRQLFGSSIDDLRSLNAEQRQQTELLVSDKIMKPFVYGKKEMKAELLKTEKTDSLDLGEGLLSPSPAKEKSKKKVHFTLPKDTNSFDLDEPSPLTLSSSVKYGRSSPSDIESRCFNESISDSGHTTRMETEKLIDEHKSVYCLKESDGERKSSLKQAVDPFEDSSNLSHLSLPDYNTTPVKKVKHGNDLNITELDDTQTIRSELDDLNISLTPEFSDCMKLLNRAEKKSLIYGGVGTDAAHMDWHTTYSSTKAESLSHSHKSQKDAVKKNGQDEYDSKVKSNPYKSPSGGVHFMDVGPGRRSVSSTTVLKQPGDHFPYFNSCLSSSYPVPTSTVPVSVQSNQSKSTSVKEIDDKLLVWGISGSKHRNSNLSNLCSRTSLPSGSVQTSNPEIFCYGADIAGKTFRSSLPISSAAQSSQNSLVSSASSLPQNLSQRRSSLDNDKNIVMEPHKIPSSQNLLSNHYSARRYSSLTNIPAAVSVSSVSASSNYSQTVGSHLSNVNHLYSTTTTSSQRTTPHFSGAFQTKSFHPGYSLSLTGGPPADVSTVPFSCIASSRPMSQLIPAVCSHSAYSLPASSYASTIYTSGRTTLPELSGQDKIEYQAAADDTNKKGNYSYVSNASDDKSSRDSDSLLLEPKKRLFESGDDLDLTLSPIKSTRIN